jgi:hypothetical protein
MVWMTIFNNVIAPCLAVLVISPQCWYYAIEEPPEVSVSYHFFECQGIYYSPSTGYHCLGKQYAERTTSYVPSAIYSNQCSSDQLENFANIYITRYLITGIGLPLLTILAKTVQELIFSRQLLPLVKKGETKESLYRNVWFRLFQQVELLMPRSLRIIDIDDYLATDVITVKNPIISSFDRDETHLETTPSMDNSLNQVSSADQRVRDTLCDIFLAYFENKKSIFVARRFTTILVGDIAIFFTFGSIYPPLALVVFVGILSQCVSQQLILGRLFTISGKYQKLLHGLRGLQQDSESVSSLLTMALPAVTELAAPFWSCVLFDILSDEIGMGPSAWILFVLTGCVLVFRLTGVYVSFKYIRMTTKHIFGEDSDDVHGEAEMTKLDKRVESTTYY